MRNSITSFAIALLAIFSIAISGCGGKDFAPVSGTVTYEGNPVDKLRVSFSPKIVGDDLAPGPYSSGETGPDGKFTLKSRYDDPGALVGTHKISFKYSDISETAMSDLKTALNDAKDLGSKEAFDEAQKKIGKLKAKLKGRPVLSGWKTDIDVPAEGYDDLKLELSELSE